MDLNGIEQLPNGARFYRCDPHVHSYGGSHDVHDTTMTPEAIMQTAVQENIAMVAITDHNEISNVQRAIDAGPFYRSPVYMDTQYSLSHYGVAFVKAVRPLKSA